jgi:iron complex outermembrane receptor protein
MLLAIPPFRPAGLLLPLLLAVVVPVTQASARQAGDTPPDTGIVRLPPVEVRATRMVSIATPLSLAITSLERDGAARDTEAAFSLEDAIRAVPGLEIEDRGHLALGERVTIRGMGGRAAFGVRGVQMLLDGVPLTMPDGQSVTEIVEPALIRRAEVIRGPSGRLWGNGSGGVIALETAATALDPAGVHLRASGGGLGERHFLAEAVARPGRTRLHAYGSHRISDGYREHSAGRITRGGIGAVLPVRGGSVLRLSFAGVDQDVEHPGSLTALERSDDPSAADARYVQTGSGKQSRQLQGIARWVLPVRGGVLEADLHGTARDLDNAMPFAWIGVDRRSGGARVGWNRTRGALTLRAGLDAAVQRDDRVNADNVYGFRGDTTLLDQRERVRTAAVSAVVEWSPSRLVSASAGLRADRISMRLDDRFSADGDQSGERSFGALSPGVSLRWAGPGWTAFAGWSTAFDMPTTTELVNAPGGSSGFNPDLGPQHTRGVETGFRAGTGTWFLDFALYSLRVRDLLASSQDPVSGRTVYENAQGASHRGAEILYEWVPSTRIRFAAHAAFQRFRLDGGPDDGNALPGFPDRRLGAEVEAGPDGLRGGIRVESVSRRYGDDANTVAIPAHVTVDVRLFHRGIPIGEGISRPFLEVRNLLDEAYAASVVVNARGGRYFEPAAGRHLVAGLSVRFGSR